MAGQPIRVDSVYSNSYVVLCNMVSESETTAFIYVTCGTDHGLVGYEVDKGNDCYVTYECI